MWPRVEDDAVGSTKPRGESRTMLVGSPILVRLGHKVGRNPPKLSIPKSCIPFGLTLVLLITLAISPGNTSDTIRESPLLVTDSFVGHVLFLDLSCCHSGDLLPPRPIDETERDSCSAESSPADCDQTGSNTQRVLVIGAVLWLEQL